MKLLKRTLCIFLSVLILFFGVSNSYFSPHKMDEAHAMGATYMTYETMQAICYYLGSLFLGYSASAEIPNLTEEEIMQAGHNFIKSLYDVSGVNPFISDQLADTTQTLFSLISNKQAYVFGSEALKEVAETEFTVIMGGGGNDDDNGDNDDDNESKTKIDIKEIGKTLGALSVQGVALFSAVVKYQLDQYNNDVDGNILAETASKYFTGYQINDAGLYVYSGNFSNWFLQSDYGSNTYMVNYGTFTSDLALVTYVEPAIDKYGNNVFGLGQIGFSAKGGIYSGTDAKLIPSHISYISYGNVLRTSTDTDGEVSQKSKSITSGGFMYGLSTSGLTAASNVPMLSTAPVYSSEAAALEDIDNGVFENALNIAKTYKIADWLQDDWAGDLVDPLTGLSYLNDLAQLAKQLGLSGLGDNPDLADIKEYLRDILQDINQQYDPDTNPLVDPALDPIPYPSTLPVPVIDPTSPIVVQPVADPDPAPSTDPDPQPSTDPVVDPVTDPVPLPENVPDGLEDIADNVPAVADSLADIGGTLKTKFPFSIPWDIYYILNGLATTPKAPYFELPLKVERYGIDETIIVDMSRFQVLSDLSRSIFSMLFMIVLINLTIKVIGSIKEES